MHLKATVELPTLGHKLGLGTPVSEFAVMTSRNRPLCSTAVIVPTIFLMLAAPKVLGRHVAHVEQSSSGHSVTAA